MIDEHKDKRKYNDFGYHSTKCWLKGNDKGVASDHYFSLPLYLSLFSNKRLKTIER